MKYKYILFDLFGTLISDEEAVGKGKVLKQKLTEPENAIFVAHWRNWHRNNYSTEEFMGNLGDLDIFSQEKMEFIKERVTLTSFEFYEDTLDTLTALKKLGYHLNLLSNSPPSPKELLENEKSLLALFDNFFWSFEMGCMKPDRQIFEMAVEDLNCQKSEVLYVGDTYENDYLGPKNVGIDAVFIDRNNTFNLNMSIRKLSDLLKLI